MAWIAIEGKNGPSDPYAVLRPHLGGRGRLKGKISARSLAKTVATLSACAAAGSDSDGDLAPRQAALRIPDALRTRGVAQKKLLGDLRIHIAILLTTITTSLRTAL
jgi:hypothetical protein